MEPILFCPGLPKHGNHKFCLTQASPEIDVKNPTLHLSLSLSLPFPSLPFPSLPLYHLPPFGQHSRLQLPLTQPPPPQALQKKPHPLGALLPRSPPPDNMSHLPHRAFRIHHARKICRPAVEVDRALVELEPVLGRREAEERVEGIDALAPGLGALVVDVHRA